MPRLQRSKDLVLGKRARGNGCRGADTRCKGLPDTPRLSGIAASIRPLFVCVLLLGTMRVSGFFLRSAETFLPRAAHAQWPALCGMQTAARYSAYPLRSSASGLAVRHLASRANVDPFVAEHVRSKPQEPLPAERVLKLSRDEKELLDLLERVVTERKLQTTVRIAGGWVRDKLLHVGEKKDVDIAVDDMTGVKFAKVLNNWATKRLGKPFRTGVIATNPEKSKHLETANMQIGEFSVDFVNLRAEQYDNTSRVPKVRTGTQRRHLHSFELAACKLAT
jgi:hypothetical protein